MSGPQPTVLVVDDERLNRAALADLLQDDYTVLIAKDGPGALEQARRHATEIMLILLDISMPGMDGYEVLSALKADEQTADIMVVFITAQSSAADEEHGLKLGAVDYIHKPIRPAIVGRRVRNLVDLALRNRALKRLVHLAGLGEGIVLIEPNEGIVWANEKALALHNVSTVHELGQTPDGYRDRFLLRSLDGDDVSSQHYPLARLLSGECFDNMTLEARRRDNVSEGSWSCVHEVRGQALVDAQGHTTSFALVILDVTDRVRAEKRFDQTFDTDLAPAVICRLSDLHYVRVNQSFLDMTGLTNEDVVGRSIYTLDILAHAPNKAEAIENLRAGHAIARTEAKLQLRRGTRSVIVAGQPIDVGDDHYMLFTFTDVEPSRKAEASLRQSEERFVRAFRLMPIPTILAVRKGFQFLDTNDAFVSVFGYTEADVTAKSRSTLPIWAEPHAAYRIERELEKTGSLRNIEVQLITNRGETLDCLLSAETLEIAEEQCALIVIQDVSERIRSEVELMAAIETVMQDASWFSRSIIEKLANLRTRSSPRSHIGELADLTGRELEILALMCRGLSDGDIVKELGLTRNTVRNHVARIYGKADVHSRAAAVVWARERGFTGADYKLARAPR
ncbi:PAS domain S-box protein [Rhizobium lusitanum]|nr:PAS domain S-box protein [Rhizobium lusitanum]